MTEKPERMFNLFNEIGIIDQLGSTAFAAVLPKGLSMAGFSVLNRFVRLGLQSDSPARMASAFQVTRGAMTNTLGRLEAAGFVDITTNPDDGRGKVVRPTELGLAARRQALAGLGPLLERVSDALSEADMDAVLPVLVKLRVWLDKARD